MTYSNSIIMTPQTQALPHKRQAPNNAGGFSFQVTQWERLERFLILGSESPTYYQTAAQLTRQNAAVVLECFHENPSRAANVIAEISFRGRAPSLKPLIFALALASVDTDDKTRAAAFRIVAPCCSTARLLFLWMRYRKELGGGSGRAYKRVLSEWYASRSTNALTYQMIKYRGDVFTHKRAIELCGRGACPGSLSNGESLDANLYLWARGKDVSEKTLPPQLAAFLQVQAGNGNLPELIAEHRLPWEALPTEALRRQDVWRALVPHMGLMGLIRNLGRMTAIGAITRAEYSQVAERIVNEDNLQAAKIHPFQLLLAQKTYHDGCGDKGKLSWNPVGGIVDALDTAFYRSFKTIVPTGRRYLLALDVSGSMGSKIGRTSLTCREAACAMSLATMGVEDSCDVVGFTASGRRWGGEDAGLTQLNISPRDRLDQAVEKISGLSFGATDCALPFVWALSQKRAYDAVVVYTDNESYAGPIHVCAALERYRSQMNLATKFAAVAFTATSYSVVDESDGGSMNFVGFDSAAPAVMADFFRK
jgi:60 kDa SS-A/Ro ribonucleoprotein